MSGTEGVMAVSIEEWNAKNAEIERLRALVKELADDLEAEVEGHYRDTKDYPSELRRYERDIESVRRARAALEPKPLRADKDVQRSQDFIEQVGDARAEPKP